MISSHHLSNVVFTDGWVGCGGGGGWGGEPYADWRHMWDQTGDKYKKLQREHGARASEAKKGGKNRLHGRMTRNQRPDKLKG